MRAYLTQIDLISRLQLAFSLYECHNKIGPTEKIVTQLLIRQVVSNTVVYTHFKIASQKKAFEHSLTMYRNSS